MGLCQVIVAQIILSLEETVLLFVCFRLQCQFEPAVQSINVARFTLNPSPIWGNIQLI